MDYSTVQGFADGLGSALGSIYWAILMTFAAIPWLYAVWHDPNPKVYLSGLGYWAGLYLINTLIGGTWLTVPLTVGTMMFLVQKYSKKEEQ